MCVCVLMFLRVCLHLPPCKLSAGMRSRKLRSRSCKSRDKDMDQLKGKVQLRQYKKGAVKQGQLGQDLADTVPWDSVDGSWVAAIGDALGMSPAPSTAAGATADPAATAKPLAQTAANSETAAQPADPTPQHTPLDQQACALEPLVPLAIGEAHVAVQQAVAASPTAAADPPATIVRRPRVPRVPGFRPAGGDQEAAGASRASPCPGAETPQSPKADLLATAVQQQTPLDDQATAVRALAPPEGSVSTPTPKGRHPRVSAPGLRAGDAQQASVKKGTKRSPQKTKASDPKEQVQEQTTKEGEGATTKRATKKPRMSPTELKAACEEEKSKAKAEALRMLEEAAKATKEKRREQDKLRREQKKQAENSMTVERKSMCMCVFGCPAKTVHASMN